MKILNADVDPADAERLAAVAARKPGDPVAPPPAPPAPPEAGQAEPKMPIEETRPPSGDVGPLRAMKHITARLDGTGDVVMFAAKAPELRMLIASAQAALAAITDGHVDETGKPLITDPRHDADEHRVSSFAVPCSIAEIQDFPAPAPLGRGMMDTPVEVPHPQAAEEKS